MMSERQVRVFRSQFEESAARWKGESREMHAVYLGIADALTLVLEESIHPAEVLFQVPTSKSEEKYRDEASKEPSPASALRNGDNTLPCGIGGSDAGNKTGAAQTPPAANRAGAARDGDDADIETRLGAYE